MRPARIGCLQALRGIVHLLAAMAFAALLTGCAYVETRYEDVTHDPRFNIGYRNNQVYRLRTAALLVQYVNGKPAEQLQLWPPEEIAGRSGEYLKLVALIPQGTLVHVEGHQYNYTFAVPPVPGDTEMLQAYGTLSTPAGAWQHVCLPSVWGSGNAVCFIQGTTVVATYADTDFLQVASPNATQTDSIAK